MKEGFTKEDFIKMMNDSGIDDTNRFKWKQRSKEELCSAHNIKTQKFNSTMKEFDAPVQIQILHTNFDHVSLVPLSDLKPLLLKERRKNLQGWIFAMSDGCISK